MNSRQTLHHCADTAMSLIAGLYAHLVAKSNQSTKAINYLRNHCVWRFLAKPYEGNNPLTTR